MRYTDQQLKEWGYLTRGRHERVPGVVYCHDHGCVHDDTTNPYGSPDDRCRKSEHRTVFVGLRRGDAPSEDT